MVLIQESVLTGMGVKAATAEKYLARLNEVLPQHGIDTPLRVAHFLAQVVMESARMEAVVENMNYSAKRLLQVFGKRFTAAEAEKFAHHPEMIGNRVYANRLGNGDEASGDGFRYRGRGLIQLTGKGHYIDLRSFLATSDPAKPDVVANPDLVASNYAVDSAVFYWTKRNINPLADADDVAAVTKAVNGATHGLDARKALLDKAKALLGGDLPDLEPITHFVTASQLNLRSAPSTSSTVVGSLGRGAGVQRAGDSATEADGQTWFQVKAVVGFQIASGFVASSFLEAAPTIDATHTVSVNTFLTLRAGPSTSAATVAELSNGTPVQVLPGTEVTADGHTWAQVKVLRAGQVVEGFVATAFLKAG